MCLNSLAYTLLDWECIKLVRLLWKIIWHYLLKLEIHITNDK